MTEKSAVIALKRDDWVKTHPVVSYFISTFAISWGGALAVITPKLLRGESIPKFTGLILFPMLLLGRLLPASEWRHTSMGGEDSRTFSGELVGFVSERCGMRFFSFRRF
jgi:hypothetical protein